MATTKKQIAPIQHTVTTLRNKASQLNEELLNASDEFIDESITTGEKVQDIIEKVLKSGTTLLEKQQTLTIHTIETLIGQYKTGNERFRKLLGFDKYQARKAKAKKVIAKRKKKKNAARVNAKTTVSNKNSLLEAVTEKQSIKKVAKKKVTAKKKVAVKKRRVTTKVDLTKIDGIGPKIASLLNKAGIQTYEQLAATKVNDLKNILAAAGKRYASYDPTTWAQQAELAAAGKWEVLAVWIQRVKAGKSNGKKKVILK